MTVLFLFTAHISGDFIPVYQARHCYNKAGAIKRKWSAKAGRYWANEKSLDNDNVDLASQRETHLCICLRDKKNGEMVMR